MSIIKINLMCLLNFFNHIIMNFVNMTNNTHMVKQWIEEDKFISQDGDLVIIKAHWCPTYFYIVKPRLQRTIGYMCNESIDMLPTKKDILLRLYRSRL